jgi:branched-chain amino acid transport system substrate-binding protein
VSTTGSAGRSVRSAVRKGAFLLAGTLALSGLAACGSSDSGGSSGGGGSTIKVAILDAQTGNLASYGQETARGAKLALDKINDAGGIKVGDKTYTFDYTVTDLQSDPTIAASAAQKAIQDGAQIVLGPGVSAMAQPVAQAVQRAAGKVLMLSSATILDTYVGGKDPIFKTITPEDLTAKEYIPVVKQQFPEITKISELFTNDAVGQSIVKTWTPVWEANGYDVASSDFFDATETNFAPILLGTPKDTQAYFAGYSDAALIGMIKSVGEADRPNSFFTRGQCQPGLTAGDAVDAYACVLYAQDPNAPSPAAATYYADYEKAYGVKTDSYSANSLYYYDYVQLLANAITKAGDTNIDDVADALRGSTYTGVMTVGFDDKGLNTTDIQVGIVKDGKLTALPPADAS